VVYLILGLVTQGRGNYLWKHPTNTGTSGIRTVTRRFAAQCALTTVLPGWGEAIGLYICKVINGYSVWVNLQGMELIRLQIFFIPGTQTF